ncbi:MAG: hypothetical protein ABI807_00735 [Sporichthyaceae bacterium]
MAQHREPSDAERLLAEVEGMLTGTSASAGPVQRAGADERPRRRVRARLRAALLAGAVAGTGVWVLFALLPFLRATSGGIGAFLAVTAATFVLRRRRD